MVSAHDDGKGDYSAEVAALAAAGGDALVVVGYADQGGAGIIQGALDTGAFSTFVLPDGMVNETLVTKFGTQLETSFGQNPRPRATATTSSELAKAAGFDGSSAFSGEAYDAAASLIMLAMQAAKSSDPKVYKDKVMEIANAPARKSLPATCRRRWNCWRPARISTMSARLRSSWSDRAKARASIARSISRAAS